MSKASPLGTLRDALQREWRSLWLYKKGAKPWHMAFAAASATGLPLLLGAYFGVMHFGLFASLGGLCFVYAPNTELYHRMAVLMACAFGMTACYTLGALSYLVPWAVVPLLTVMTIVVTMIQRYYNLGPPGTLFFVMPAMIAAYTMSPAIHLFTAVGVFSAGTTLAVAIAFAYSLYAIPRGEVESPARVVRNFNYVIVEPVFLGLTVGASLAVATLLQLPRPYWVPISCIAVMQVATFRDVWRRQLHRIIGTLFGVFIGLALLQLPLNIWGVALMMFTLFFAIEYLIPRNYALAVVFITPMTLLLVESVTRHAGIVPNAAWIRLLDTVVGSLMGLLGAAFMHHPRTRSAMVTALRRVVRRANVRAQEE